MNYYLQFKKTLQNNENIKYYTVYSVLYENITDKLKIIKFFKDTLNCSILNNLKLNNLTLNNSQIIIGSRLDTLNSWSTTSKDILKKMNIKISIILKTIHYETTETSEYIFKKYK